MLLSEIFAILQESHFKIKFGNDIIKKNLLQLFEWTKIN